jgi:hypothetical protein
MDEKSLTIWTIYRNPGDHPGKWVLRAHDVGPGTTQARPGCYIANSYEELLSSLPSGLDRLPRDAYDDPVIYECWI